MPFRALEQCAELFKARATALTDAAEPGYLKIRADAFVEMSQAFQSKISDDGDVGAGIDRAIKAAAKNAKRETKELHKLVGNFLAGLRNSAQRCLESFDSKALRKRVNEARKQIESTFASASADNSRAAGTNIKATTQDQDFWKKAGERNEKLAKMKDEADKLIRELGQAQGEQVENLRKKTLELLAKASQTQREMDEALADRQKALEKEIEAETDQKKITELKNELQQVLLARKGFAHNHKVLIFIRRILALIKVAAVVQPTDVLDKGGNKVGSVKMSGGKHKGTEMKDFKHGEVVDAGKLWGVGVIAEFDAVKDAKCNRWCWVQLAQSTFKKNGKEVEKKTWFVDGPFEDKVEPCYADGTFGERSIRLPDNPGFVVKRAADVAEFFEKFQPVKKDDKIEIVFEFKTWLLCIHPNVIVFGHLFWSFPLAATITGVTEDGKVKEFTAEPGQIRAKWVSAREAENNYDVYKKVLKAEEFPDEFIPEKPLGE